MVGKSEIAYAQDFRKIESADFFLGTSPDAERCGRAFFFYLDQRRNSGGIFVVNKMDKFRSLSFGNNGDIEFEWTDLGDENYQFSGRFTPDGFSGDISRQSPKTRDGSFLCELSATGLILDGAPKATANQVGSHRFTNEGYSSEGGDPTGVDIRFFSTKNGPAGVATFYAGNWDEPMFRPLVLSHIEKKGHLIRFDAAVPDGLRHYELITNMGGALLCRDSQDSEAKRNCTSLRRDQHVLPLIDW
jgi:hypothetical protein